MSCSAGFEVLSACRTRSSWSCVPLQYRVPTRGSSLADRWAIAGRCQRASIHKEHERTRGNVRVSKLTISDYEFNEDAQLCSESTSDYCPDSICLSNGHSSATSHNRVKAFACVRAGRMADARVLFSKAILLQSPRLVMRSGLKLVACEAHRHICANMRSAVMYRPKRTT